MTVHLVLQGKGGVGKSLVASLLTQYFYSRGEVPLCGDTDSVNDTFARYGRYNAKRINILNQDNNIDPRVFDSMIEMILQHEGTCIIDNGASTFVPLSSYIAESGALDLLADSGKKVIIHSVITGGQAMDDTVTGAESLLETQNAPLVIWANEYFGEISQNGKNLEQAGFYREYKDKILGTVRIYKRNPDTFGKDIELMVSQKLTFDEVMDSSAFGMMPKQRLKMFKNSVFEQLDRLRL